MNNYTNQTCPVCGQKFTSESDVVVCPECGTPHHRQCWTDLGHCANEDKHFLGYTWRPEVVRIPESKKQCPKCGAIVDKDASFCENCGAPFAQNQVNYTAQNTAANTMTFEQFQQMRQSMIDAQFSGEIDGIPTKEVAAYIGPHADYYIKKFRKMDEKPKFKPFSVLAFLASPLWFLYRKLTIPALIAFGINAIFNIPTTIINSVSMGVGTLPAGMTMATLENLSIAGTVITTIISIIFGFIAEPMYRKSVIKKLNSLKMQANGDENLYRQLIAKNSGPSKVGQAVCLIFVLLELMMMFY